MDDIIQQIKDQINSNPVLLFMKGSPDFPRCGFSATAVDILKSYNQPFSFVDVLSNPEVRANLPQIANWPTFPQLWINGELIGGSDIMNELHTSGELAKQLSNIS